MFKTYPLIPAACAILVSAIVTAMPATAQKRVTSVSIDPATQAEYSALVSAPEQLLRQSNGVSSWSVRLPEGPITAIAASPAGKVFVLAGGSLVRLNSHSGIVESAFALTGMTARSLVADSAGAVYAGGDGFVRKLDGNTWNTDTVNADSRRRGVCAARHGRGVGKPGGFRFADSGSLYRCRRHDRHPGHQWNLHTQGNPGRQHRLFCRHPGDRQFPGARSFQWANGGTGQSLF